MNIDTIYDEHYGGRNAERIHLVQLLSDLVSFCRVHKVRATDLLREAMYENGFCIENAFPGLWPLFGADLRGIFGGEDDVVVSPDELSQKRASRLRHILESHYPRLGFPEAASSFLTAVFDRESLSLDDIGSLLTAAEQKDAHERSNGAVTAIYSDEFYSKADLRDLFEPNNLTPMFGDKETLSGSEVIRWNGETDGW